MVARPRSAPGGTRGAPARTTTRRTMTRRSRCVRAGTRSAAC